MWKIYIWSSIGFIWLGSFLLYLFDHGLHNAIGIASYASAAILLALGASLFTRDL